MKFNPVDFSKFDQGQAVARLECLQAQLAQLAKAIHGRLKSKVDGGNELQPAVAFTDGTLHATCSALDLLQGRPAGTNLREIMGVKEPTCEQPLFV